MSSQPRFMLIEGESRYAKGHVRWLIVSSSDMVNVVRNSQDLDPLVSNGTIRPNNFGHLCERYASGWPEEQVIHQRSIKEHHGYFRTLCEVRDYIKMMELVNV